MITQVLRFSKLTIAGVILLCALLFTLDQNRLQPWVYFYFLLFVTLISSDLHWTNNGADETENQQTVGNAGQSSVIFTCQLIMIAVYFWSAVHKFNHHFLHEVFEPVIQRIFHFQDQRTVASLLPIGYLIPVIELLIAISLSIPKTRKVGVYLAVISHLVILLYLFSNTNNSIVIPWNISMMLLDIILFYKNERTIRLIFAIPQVRRIILFLILTLAWIMPFLNCFGWWDDYLSFNLYSGDTKELFIAISDQELEKSDHRFDHYFLKMPSNIKGGKIISANKWAIDELNVPVYPEKRVFNFSALSFCNASIGQENVVFLVSKGSLSESLPESFTCSDLKKR